MLDVVSSLKFQLNMQCILSWSSCAVLASVLCCSAATDICHSYTSWCFVKARGASGFQKVFSCICAYEYCQNWDSQLVLSPLCIPQGDFRNHCGLPSCHLEGYLDSLVHIKVVFKEGSKAQMQPMCKRVGIERLPWSNKKMSYPGSKLLYKTANPNLWMRVIMSSGLSVRFYHRYLDRLC